METARLIQWITAMGLTEKDACACITFMATGTGLPVQPEEKKEQE